MPDPSLQGLQCQLHGRPADDCDECQEDDLGGVCDECGYFVCRCAGEWYDDPWGEPWDDIPGEYRFRDLRRRVRRSRRADRLLGRRRALERRAARGRSGRARRFFRILRRGGGPCPRCGHVFDTCNCIPF